jgi:hypothetical protein
MEEKPKATIALVRRFSGRCNLWTVDVASATRTAKFRAAYRLMNASAHAA